MNTAIDLSRLAPPAVIEPLNYDEIRQALMSAITERLPEHTLLASDPAVKVLEVAAYRELLLRQRINDAAQAVMLAFAAGSNLDHLGALFGVARSQGESDERYRARIPLSLESHSMAGTNGAYQFQAMSADPRVRDVHVASNTPGVVEVTVLTELGADQAAVQAAVSAHLNHEDVRPLTDQVQVTVTRPTSVVVDAHIYLNPGVNETQVRLAIDTAMDDFNRAHTRLGKEIPHSAIIDMLHQGGVRKIKLLSPSDDIVPEATQAVSLSLQLSFL
ncbi:baseplate assembly protein [Pseudoalteromonas viridis]|uniref:Baseplate J/gp47 family protein n=1 Tax=Pseudoalteromonas viridis TaxID=339617 RepID=A0ABX7UZM0_9GAMM|nr:baseplate J/gp47 family protein [Pseudoalteromonas viridis]QTL34086.1 baseplate J/gp47 family protein [Pseudoalteromonas viridis]